MGILSVKTGRKTAARLAKGLTVGGGLLAAVMLMGCGGESADEMPSIVAAQVEDGELAPEEVYDDSAVTADAETPEDGEEALESSDTAASDDVIESSRKGNKVIYLLLPSEEGFSLKEKDLLTTAVVDRGYSVTARTYDCDSDTQTAFFSEAMTHGAAAVICDSLGGDETVEAVSAARDVGVPTFLIDDGISVGGIARGQVITNKAARIDDLAKWLLENRNGALTYAVLEDGSAEAEDAATLFRSAVRRGKDVVFADKAVTAEGDRAAAAEQVKTWVSHFPAINLIVCGSDDGAFGAAEALEELNMTDSVNVICLDSDEDGMISLVEEGKVQAAVVKSPERLTEEVTRDLEAFFMGNSAAWHERCYVDADILTLNGVL